MLTWALLFFFKAALNDGRALKGAGQMLVLSMVADVAIVGLITMPFWNH